MGKSLHIIVVERDGRVVALAPFMIVHESVMGIPVRKVQFISMMREAAHPTSVAGHLDIIAAPDAHDAVAAVFDYLRREKHLWDCIQLHPIPDDSVTLTMLSSLKSSNLNTSVVRPVNRNWLVRVQVPWSDYVKAHKGEFKHATRNISNFHENKGTGRIVEYERIDEVLGGFDTLLDIERRSWKWDTGISLNAAIYRGFYKRLAQNLSETGMLRLALLEIDGVKVAYDFQVQLGSVIWGLKISYDDNYRKLSPGKALMYFLFRKAHQNGITTVDMLWGEEKFKISHANSSQCYSEVMLFGRSLRGMLCRAFLSPNRFSKGLLYSGELKRRLFRKLGIRSKTSELTREDQLLGKE